MIITETAALAQRLLDEIRFFDPGLRVHMLPDWETLPYDHFSPHQDLVSQRLATLHHVSHRECNVLVVAATTALYRLAPPQYIAGHTFFFLVEAPNAHVIADLVTGLELFHWNTMELRPVVTMG